MSENHLESGKCFCGPVASEHKCEIRRDPDVKISIEYARKFITEKVIIEKLLRVKR